jgi:hypothetical protein
VDLTIVPEPDPQQRKAVELALTRLLDGNRSKSVARSAWWEAGIAEDVEDDAGEDCFR